LDQDLARISQRVRQWREELGLSLHELAVRSDVAASTIQKVETGQMVPSIAVLLKIARGLDRRPAEVVSEQFEEAEVVLQRAKQHPTISPIPKLKVERLSGDLFDPALEVWRVHAHPGQGSGRGEYSYPGEEVVICEDGEVTFIVGGEEHRLRTGDALHFKGGIPHRWQNEGDVPTRFLVAGNFPKGLRAKLHRQMRPTRRRSAS
jgi:transcriptional regulator with XRE-family HTH domain